MYAMSPSRARTLANASSVTIFAFCVASTCSASLAVSDSMSVDKSMLRNLADSASFFALRYTSASSMSDIATSNSRMRFNKLSFCAVTSASSESLLRSCSRISLNSS